MNQPHVFIMLAFTKRYIVSILFIILVAIIGTNLLLHSHAATPTVSVETENGNVHGCAVRKTDNTASNGQAVQYQAAPTSNIPATVRALTPPSHYSYLRGINVYTLEIERNTPSADPFCYGEPQSSYDYLASHGIKSIRLAFSWGLLQPIPAGGSVQDGLNGPINQTYLQLIKNQVAEIEHAGMYPVIDLHNGCGYPNGPGTAPAGEVYCGAGITQTQMGSIWKVLSDTFKDDPNIQAYDIMNEPKATTLAFDTYKTYSQAVVNTIRGNGDNHPIWVESMTTNNFNLSSSAPDGPWITFPGTSIVDTTDIIYSQHFYPGGTGTTNHQYGVGTSDPTYASFLNSLSNFASWCKAGHVRCSIGEVGWPNEASQTAWPGSGASWTALGNQFYDIADTNGLDANYFAGSSYLGGYLSAYNHAASHVVQFPVMGINYAESQDSVIQAHGSQ